MITTVNITLNSNPVNGDGFEITVDGTSSTITFKNTPTSFNDVQIMPTVSQTAYQLWGKLDDLYILNPDVSVEVSGNVVTLYLTDLGVEYDKVIGDISIAIGKSSTAFNITGIESNGLLINNDIWLNISFIGQAVRYYTINITNLETQQSTGDMRIDPRPDGQIKINIAPHIKAYFTNPYNDTTYNGLDAFVTGNWNPFRITISAYYMYLGSLTNQSTIIERNFIRGGKRTLKWNQNVTVGQILRPSIQLPIWAGYPVAEYTVNDQFQIEKNTNLPTVANKDYRKVKGCDPIYIKFKNALGGYSNWMFEAWSNEQSNDNLGVVNNNQDIRDLGNAVDFRIGVYSKVPERYHGLIEDLIISEQIYLYNKAEHEWIQVTSDNNKTERKTFANVYEVKLKFRKYVNFNPSLLWSR